MNTAFDLRTRVAAELIRTQYHQLQRSSIVVAVFVVAIVWNSSSTYWIFAWAAAYAIFLSIQELMLQLFRRAAPDDTEILAWGTSAAILLALSGLLWGLGFYFFIDPEQPLVIGLLIAAMAAITVGAVALRSTILPGFYAFIILVCGFMAFRFLRENDNLFTILGLSMLLYAPAILKYGRLQHRLIADSISVRMSNDELVAALRDETLAAEAARRDAEQANLAKSQFLAAASHDLRQPLYALNLFSASLSELQLDSAARGIVQDIQGSITTMESLFVGLLDISKLDAGVVTAQQAAVSVDAVFDRLSQYFWPIAVDRGLEMRFRSDGEWVLSDALLLEQVLGNLIANALRWTSRGGVLIAARRRGPDIRLEVWDTGVGISAEDQQRIFDDFVQVENAERDGRKGLGLGLAIARRASRLLKSDIAVASRLAVGSRFAITQPAAAPPQRTDDCPAPAKNLEPIPDRDVTLPVLIVEDDPVVGAALRHLLTGWNVDVVLVTDARAARSAIHDGLRFGLVLTDYRLPRQETGLELARIVRQHHQPPVPPVVLITGDVGDHVVSAAHAADVRLLHKPLDVGDLRRLLNLSET